MSLDRAVTTTLFSLCFMLACSREPAPSEQGGAAPASDVPAVAVQSACAQMCMSPGSTVQVLRDEHHAPRRLRAQGITKCRSAPAIYLDMAGTVTETIANQPVVRGSDEQAQFAARIRAEEQGLHYAEQLSCP